MAARIGRPPLFRRRVKFEVLFEAGEVRAIKRAAKKRDQSASAFVRSVTLAALKVAGEV